MTLQQLATFLGWCSVINIAVLLFTTVFVIIFRDQVARIHGTLFRLDDQNLSRAYFRYLAHFKIMVIIFNLVPYIALKVMM